VLIPYPSCDLIAEVLELLPFMLRVEDISDSPVDPLTFLVPALLNMSDESRVRQSIMDANLTRRCLAILSAHEHTLRRWHSPSLTGTTPASSSPVTAASTTTTTAAVKRTTSDVRTARQQGSSLYVTGEASLSEIVSISELLHQMLQWYQHQVTSTNGASLQLSIVINDLIAVIPSLSKLAILLTVEASSLNGAASIDALAHHIAVMTTLAQYVTKVCLCSPVLFLSVS
jgi:hypothetical protein